MANPVAGWYPDPSGDPTKLRWWDGNQWTNDYAAAQTNQPQTQAAPTNAAGQGNFAQSQVDPNQAYQANQASQVNQVSQVSQGDAQYAQAQYVAEQQTYGPMQISSSDRTLRLVAFIFMLISTIGTCWLILPLAWMIPMSVHCWGLYKGTKANSVAFGVCTLLFVSLVGGILLLCSKKER